MCTHRLHTYNIYPYLTIFSFNNRNISRKIYKRKLSLSLSLSLSPDVLIQFPPNLEISYLLLIS